MIKYIIAMACFTIGMQAQAADLGNIFGNLFGRAGAGHDMTVDETLARVSKQMNKKMPVTVSKDTRLDKVSAEPGRHFTYYYTLIDAQTAVADDFQSKVPQMKSQLCKNNDMQFLFKNGIAVSYLYRGIDGQQIGRIDLKPAECGSNA